MILLLQDAATSSSCVTIINVILGYDVTSLAIIDEMTDTGEIIFREQ